MEQKIQGYLHPNIQKPSDEQYFKYKQLVEDELVWIGVKKKNIFCMED